MTFSAAHILATAAITGLAAAAAAWWRLRRWPDVAAVFLVSGAAVFLWRISANMPQLNDDGLPGFPPMTGRRRSSPTCPCACTPT